MPGFLPTIVLLEIGRETFWLVTLISSFWLLMFVYGQQPLFVFSGLYFRFHHKSNLLHSSLDKDALCLERRENFKPQLLKLARARCTSCFAYALKFARAWSINIV